MSPKVHESRAKPRTSAAVLPGRLTQAPGEAQAAGDELDAADEPAVEPGPVLSCRDERSAKRGRRREGRPSSP